jgi:Protein of unknown function (DUF4242)
MRRRRPRRYSRSVPSFLVFRDLPGVTRDQYAAAQRAAADAARRAGGANREVTYQGGFFLPATARAICIFDAETAADVIAVNELAGLPTTSVVEAIDLRAATGQPLAP